MAIDQWAVLENQGHAKPVVETWVASELLKLISATDHRLQLYFWRTQTGQEMDFLIERGGRLVAIEVKWAHRIEESDVANLKRCAGDLKEKFIFL
jgi:predicted AAA+ superfamily ATPase